MLLLGLFCLIAGPAHATLHEVSVLTQAEGASREAAKQDAITRAKQQAVIQVATKLDPGKARAYLAKLGAAGAEELVRGYTIDKEEHIKGVYYARVLVTVMDGPIKRAYGDAPSEEPKDQLRQTRTLLVLPVFFDGKKPAVWDPKENPTLRLWQDAALEVAKGAFVLPKGDPRERAVVDYDNALTAGYDDLKTLMTDYGADEMVIAVMSDSLVTDGVDEVQVVLRRIRAEGQKLQRFVVTPDEASAKRDPLYAKAVKQTADMLAGIAEATSHVDANMRKDAKAMPVILQFNTLRDWGILQQKLRVPEEFVGADMRSLRLHEANGTLYVKGPIDLYVAKLEGQGVKVQRVGDNLWSLR